MRRIKLGDIWVGNDCAPYIIAEIGSNHNGDMALCRAMIDAAAEAGAHAVKFQSWTENSLIAREEFERNTSYSDTKRHFGSLQDMVKKYQFTAEQHKDASSYCQTRGIAFSSSAFSIEEVDLLTSLNVPFIKIASMDINNTPLLRYAAQSGRPLLLSTGMSTLGEIERALEVVRGAGNDDIVLFHCISVYPPDDNDIHLNNIRTLAQAFDVVMGFSDHSLGTAVPLASVACGARVIEKHFTIDTNLEGWDHAISATPQEMAALVRGSATVFRALGSRQRIVSEAEIQKRTKMRRSLVAARALPRGTVIKDTDLLAKRPGTGIPLDQSEFVVGRKLVRDIRDDQLLAWTDFE